MTNHSKFLACHRKLQAQLEANLGPDPINPAASLSGIAARLYDRMQALAVEQERLKIQYRTCVEEIDRISTARRQ